MSAIGTRPFAVRFERTGGPEVLECEAIEVGEPGPGEVRIAQRAVGLNFIDTYFRTGVYPAQLPGGLGNEAAGVVEAVGEGVAEFREGDRVGYFTGPLGAYASVRNVEAARLVPIPDAIDFDQAAAAMLKGCTAEYLVERCAKVEAGWPVLVHAAAGGVGSILVQWLKAIGATVIAHAGDERKAGIAKDLGADHALSCPMDLLAPKVRELTGGSGVPVVLDGVGAASWEASLAATARRGLLVSYGNASGASPPVSALELMRAGSIFLTRPTLGDYCPTPEAMRASAARLFAMMESGAVKIQIGQRFPLADAADAHRALEGRATTGSTVLVP
jgi:NADPH2:quinone reductase